MNKAALGLVVLLASALVGCGKAPASAVAPKAQRELSVRRVQPVVKATVALTPETSTTGVLVGDRWYAKGEEPTAQANEALPDPEAGKGHLSVEVPVRNVTSWIGAYRVILLAAGESEPLVEATYTGEALKGSGFTHDFTNLPPGAYQVVVAIESAGRVVGELKGRGAVAADAAATLAVK